jgi:hypothetical protein
MVAITHSAANVSRSKSAGRARASRPHQNLIGRFFTAVMEARLQQAYREINRRAYLFDKPATRNFH